MLSNQSIRQYASVLLLLGLFGRAGEARQSELPAGAPTSPAAAAPAVDRRSGFGGPLAPAPPDVISRDPSGRVTIRAIRITEALQIDGKLDDLLYQTVQPASGFLQIEPQEGAPATEKTDVWIGFDAANLYVSVRCWETQPEKRVANEMRRDVMPNWDSNDFVSISIDPMNDGRNGIWVVISPLGGRNDGEIGNEQSNGMDFNPVWTLRTGKFEQGWTVEAAFPFKTLRYETGKDQVWGINLLRRARAKNEYSSLVPLPISLGSSGALTRLSLAADVVGLQVPATRMNLEVKPYLTSSLASDLTASPRVIDDVNADFGVDAKVGITKSLMLDVTYNTDFAQVEADEQQTNLTRFSLFFPEKRDFFLENQSTFSFGGVGGGPRSVGDAPTLFYSRRIGLNAGRLVPVEGGGRLAGRVGAFDVGVLNLQAGDETVSQSPSTNFSVVRVRRDVLRRSSVGAIITNRSVGQRGSGASQSYGVDGTFKFFTDLSINSYFARTDTAAIGGGDDTSYRGQLDYAGDRYGLQLERLVVGKRFNPEMGFLPRSDIRKNFASVRFSPRPRSRTIRKLTWLGSVDHFENDQGQLVTRELTGEFGILFQNSDQITLRYIGNHELVLEPFRLPAGVTIPAGVYDFDTALAEVIFGQQRSVYGKVSAEHGTFYGGHRTAARVFGARVMLTPQLSAEPTTTLNWLDMPQGSFFNPLVGSRVTYTATPLMFVSALIQYSTDTHALSSNIRLRWEYRPGSEFFVVYNEARNMVPQPFEGLTGRAFIVKVNRLIRF